MKTKHSLIPRWSSTWWQQHCAALWTPSCSPVNPALCTALIPHSAKPCLAPKLGWAGAWIHFGSRGREMKNKSMKDIENFWRWFLGRGLLHVNKGLACTANCYWNNFVYTFMGIYVYKNKNKNKWTVSCSELSLDPSFLQVRLATKGKGALNK